MALSLLSLFTPFKPWVRAVSALLLGVCFAALPGQSATGIILTRTGSPQNGNKAQVSARAIRVEVRLTRTDTGNPAPDAAKEAPKADALPTPASTAPGIPVVVGAPVLNTLDRNTATVSVNGTGTSYTLAVSPVLEKSDTAVQVLWNMRVSGKDFPGGASAFTLSGANRITLGAETLVGEIPLTDKTGRVSTFKLLLKATLTDTAPSTTPVTATVPASPAPK